MILKCTLNSSTFAFKQVKPSIVFTGSSSPVPAAGRVHGPCCGAIKAASNSNNTLYKVLKADSTTRATLDTTVRPGAIEEVGQRTIEQDMDMDIFEDAGRDY